MRLRFLAAAFALALIGACLPRASYSSCANDTDCSSAGAGARCEANHSCSLEDDSCPGTHHRYDTSAATSAGQCVPDGSAIDGGTDGTPDTMLAAPPPDRECVVGIALPTTYSSCAAKVDAKEPRCGTDLWDPVCVRWAETLCPIGCAGMVFVGTDHALVMRASDHHVMWSDAPDSDYGFAGAWGDYDNDGDPDLAFVGNVTLSVYRNDGIVGDTLVLTPVAQTKWTTITAGKAVYISGNDVQWADFDGDHRLDVSFAGGGGLIIFQNQGNDAFGPMDPLLMAPDAQPQPNVNDIAWADITGDHLPELVAFRSDPGPVFYRNDPSSGTPGVTRKMTPVTWGSTLGYTHNAEWCNLDPADAAPELVVSSTGGIHVYDTTDGVPAMNPTAVGDMAGDVHCAPLDADDDLDLIATNYDSSRTAAYAHNPNTLTSFSKSFTQPATGAETNSANSVVGDFDGDHKLDLLQGGNQGAGPVAFQLLHNATTSPNALKFNADAEVKLTAIPSATYRMAIAPLLGKAP